MKKNRLALLLLLLPAHAAIACDICGCGPGSYYTGLLPEFSRRFAGIRYQHKHMRSHIGPGGVRTYLTTDETYQSAEFWGAFNLGPKFRIMGIVPVNRNSRINQGITTRASGQGDAAVFGYYQVFNSRLMAGQRLLAHSLWMGMGLKLPLGAYNPEEKNIAQGVQNNFQLGTGSFDAIFTAAYDIRLMDVGVNTNISVKLNTPNPQEYLYGSKLTVNSLLYYKISASKLLRFTPNAGVLYEVSARDRKNRTAVVDDSGGFSVMALAGLEAAAGRVGAGFNFQKPLQQQLAAGRVAGGNRWLLHISYSF